LFVFDRSEEKKEDIKSKHEEKRTFSLIKQREITINQDIQPVQTLSDIGKKRRNSRSYGKKFTKKTKIKD